MYNKISQVVIAFLLVAIGSVLLLSNLNIISLEMRWTWGNIYPIILLVIGLKIWMDALLKRGGSWIVGSFLTIFSTLLLTDRLGVIEFSFGDMWKLWPLLFVYFGFSIFLRRSSSILNVEYDFEGSSSKKKKSKHMMIGDHSYSEENWKVEPVDLWNGVGDYRFDFTRAFIPDGDTPIIVRGWVGDVKMLIPKHIPYRVDAKVKTGDIRVGGQKAEGMHRSVEYETDDYSMATRRLTIGVDLKVGSIRIEQV